MFESITDFFNEIMAFEINIPLSVQIGIIVIVMISLTFGAYLMKDFFDISYMRNGVVWFIFVAILNLSTILAIFIYYNTKSTTYVGVQGQKGKRGKMGKKGKSVTCSYCNNNLYIQSVRDNDIICKLNVYTSDFKLITENIKFFQNIIDKGNNIDYDSFINGIILGKTVNQTANDSVNRFTNLMNPTSIAYQLIQVINDSISKSSKNVYGTFRHPKGKVGYISLGDAVYGGLEDFKLNSFVVNGDLMYPSSNLKLVSFKSYNINTEQDETYTLWRPQGQTITDNKGFKGSSETFNYFALGDVCRFGTSEPNIKMTATIKESCLTPIPSSDLILVFIYVGPLTFSDENTIIDYTKSDSYLIENNVANDVQIFSVWRTPINTFLTNCNSQNYMVNNTFIYNIYNNSYDALNKYGNISTEYKNRASYLLQSIAIPRILVASIFCKHFQTELRKEIVYYFNRYKHQVPEFSSINPAVASFGTLMTKIENTKLEYEKYNEMLVKKANLSLVGEKAINYDSTQERHLPKPLLTVYDSINEKLATISIRVENANNLLDIINVIFDNGIETRIAIDSEGIAEGGSLINGIQNTIIMICKVLFPPTQSAYMIKDECLGTFSIDREREKLIRDFTEKIGKYYEYTDDIASDPDKYIKVMPNIRQYQSLMDSQIGQVCGHIDDYQTKINNLNLEEFTTSRIKQLLSFYTQMNLYFEKVFSTL